MIVAESSSGIGAGVLLLGVVLYIVAALPLMGVFGKAGQRAATY